MSAGRVVLVLLPMLALTAGARAQNAERDAGQAELDRMQRQLQQNQGDVERLLDLRLRHDLGLPVQETGELFRATQPATTVGMEQSRSALEGEEARTTELRRQFDQLKAAVDQLAAQGRSQPRRSPPASEWTELPHPGGVLAGARPPRPPAAPEVETAAVGTGSEDLGQVPAQATAAGTVAVLRMEPVRGQIHGSQDHGRVAMALYRAAEALMERAARLRQDGNGEVANQLDGEARERLTRAVDALQPGLAQPKPSFADLFALGRCREALFRLDERLAGLSLKDQPREYQRREQEVREPFVAITVRDVQSKGGVDTLGMWGRAAQSALDHFRWLNLHGNYQPGRDPASITWRTDQKP